MLNGRHARRDNASFCYVTVSYSTESGVSGNSARRCDNDRPPLFRFKPHRKHPVLIAQTCRCRPSPAPQSGSCSARLHAVARRGVHGVEVLGDAALGSGHTPQADGSHAESSNQNDRVDTHENDPAATPLRTTIRPSAPTSCTAITCFANSRTTVVIFSMTSPSIDGCSHFNFLALRCRTE